MPQYLYLHKPEVVFAARVNQSVFSYPLAQFTFDTVTTGSYTNAQAGNTILFGTTPGGSDLGIQRVRKSFTSTVGYIGWSSRGKERLGEVNLQNDAYVTVLNDYRVWPRYPRILSNGTHYKDYDIAVGGYGTDQPPVANAGVPVAGFVDSFTGKLRVTLPHEANTSFDPNGDALTYSWFLPTGVTLVGGSLTDSQITVDCDPGFYYISLTVTANGLSHIARVPVLAAQHTGDYAPVRNFQLQSLTARPEGRELTFRLLEDVNTEDYPDGSYLMVWQGEGPSDPTDRDHMIFTGWHIQDQQNAERQKTGLVRDVNLTAYDAGRRLAMLPGFEQIIQHKDNPNQWQEMYQPDLNDYLLHLIYWHSTACDVVDFTWSVIDNQFPFEVLGSDGGTLYDQIDSRARAFTPDNRLVCNRHGQLKIVVDPMLQDVADRTSTVQTTLTAADIKRVEFTNQPNPRIHWMRGEAILTGRGEIRTVFNIAPGDAPGQGESAQDAGEQLARSQIDLNSQTGHRYARVNAPESHWTFDLRSGVATEIDPAEMTWVQINGLDKWAAQRGAKVSNARFLPVEKTVNYSYTQTGIIETVSLRAEREVTSGTPAVTVYMPEDDLSDLDDLPPYDPIPPYEPIADDTATGVITDITQSPAMYVATNTYILRNRTPGSTAITWEVVLDNSYFENYPIHTIKLDPWDSKNSMYVMCAGPHIYRVTNLDGPPFTQTVTKLGQNAGLYQMSYDMETRIDREGALVIATGYNRFFDTLVHRINGYGEALLGPSNSIPTDIPYNVNVAVGTKGTGTVYVGGNANLSIYRSTDLGASFSVVATFTTAPSNAYYGGHQVCVPYADNPNDDKFYATPGPYAVLGYHDGNTFNEKVLPYELVAGFRNKNLFISTFDHDRIAGLFIRAADDPCLGISNDGGDTWTFGTKIETTGGGDLTALTGSAFTILGGWPWDDDIYFVRTKSLGLLMTTDAGQTYASLKGNWNDIGSGELNVNSVGIVWTA